MIALDVILLLAVCAMLARLTLLHLNRADPAPEPVRVRRPE